MFKKIATVPDGFHENVKVDIYQNVAQINSIRRYNTPDGPEYEFFTMDNGRFYLSHGQINQQFENLLIGGML